MKSKIATVAVIGGLAITGTAVAAGAGPAGGLFGDDHSQELAEDLAAELDGVNPTEVGQALESVAEDRRAEHRAQMAEGIAAQLDGVDASAVEDVLTKHEEQVRESIEAGERPDMSTLVTTLAEELGKSEEEITTALEAAREAGIEEREAEMLDRLDEAVENGDVSEEQADAIRERIESGPPAGGPGGPVGPPHGPGGFGPGGPGFGPEGGPPAEGRGSNEGAATDVGELPSASA